MDRDVQRNKVEPIVDLGSVTAETKGAGFQGGDTVGQFMVAGLSDD